MTEFEQQKAFPSVAANWHKTGTTLRDYFAAKAMQGLLASGSAAYPVDNAMLAYRQADAMMKERK